MIKYEFITRQINTNGRNYTNTSFIEEDTESNFLRVGNTNNTITFEMPFHIPLKITELPYQCRKSDKTSEFMVAFASFENDPNLLKLQFGRMKKHLKELGFYWINILCFNKLSFMAYAFISVADLHYLVIFSSKGLRFAYRVEE